MFEQVRGLAEANSLLERVPAAAETEMRILLEVIAQDVLAAQKHDVPKDTGYLESTLKIVADQIARLRVKIGLFKEGRRAGNTSNFYGRIVEFGRKAQTVIVQRRRRSEGLLRIRRGRKRAEDIAATYALHVKARPPRPFVLKDRPELRVDQRIAEFWSGTINRAGGAA